MGSIPERGRGADARLRGPYAEDLEPALEFCVKHFVKAQRKTGVNGFEPDAVMRQLGWYRRTFGPFLGWKVLFYMRKT